MMMTRQKIHVAKHRKPTPEEREQLLSVFSEEAGPSYKPGKKVNNDAFMIDVPRAAAATWGDGTLCDRVSRWYNLGYSPTITVAACSGHGADIIKLVPPVPIATLEDQLADAKKLKQAGVDQRRKWRDQKADLTKLIDASREEMYKLDALIENLTKQIDARTG